MLFFRLFFSQCRSVCWTSDGCKSTFTQSAAPENYTRVNIPTCLLAGDVAIEFCEFRLIIGGSKRYLIGLKSVFCPKLWEFRHYARRKKSFYVRFNPWTMRGEIDANGSPNCPKWNSSFLDLFEFRCKKMDHKCKWNMSSNYLVSSTHA